MRGLELEQAYRFTDYFAVDASMAWTLTAKYSSYVPGPCYPGRVPASAATGSCNLTGQCLGFVPEMSFNITRRLNVPIADGLKLAASSTLIYQSSKFLDVTGDPLRVQEAFTNVDALISIGSEDDRWELALLGRNLTNRITASFGARANLAANPARFSSSGVKLSWASREQEISIENVGAI